VENRETNLPRPFLRPGDNFSKSFDENRFVWQLTRIRSQAAVPRGRAPTKSGFRHNFSKNCPQDLKNGFERCPLRFSTICAKNRVRKLNIDKVTVILRRKSPFLVTLPCTTAVVYEYSSTIDNNMYSCRYLVARSK
jgi:hypothetical protein